MEIFGSGFTGSGHLAGELNTEQEVLLRHECGVASVELQQEKPGILQGSGVGSIISGANLIEESNILAT